MEFNTSYSDPEETPETGADTALDSSDSVACPYCGESILPVAKKCKHCGEFLDPELRQQAAASANPDESRPIPVHVIREAGSERGTSPAVAGLCSLVLPGLGQIVTGRIGAGIAWMFFTLFAYRSLGVRGGFILHVICIVDAVRGTDKSD